MGDGVIWTRYCGPSDSRLRLDVTDMGCLDHNSLYMKKAERKRRKAKAITEHLSRLVVIKECEVESRTAVAAAAAARSLVGLRCGKAGLHWTVLLICLSNRTY